MVYITNPTSMGYSGYNLNDIVMKDALKYKFIQNSNLRQMLLQTGDSTIVEHTSHDSYWGDGGDGSGKNVLGLLLMELRNELRQSEQYGGTKQDDTSIYYKKYLKYKQKYNELKNNYIHINDEYAHFIAEDIFWTIV